MAKGNGTLIEMPGTEPLTSAGRLRRGLSRLGWIWKYLLLVGAIGAAGWGARGVIVTESDRDLDNRVTVLETQMQSIQESLRWTAQAIWELSRGSRPAGPPPQ